MSSDIDSRIDQRFQMHSEGGQTWFVEGHKKIHTDPGIDIWSETTQLYITVYDGPNDKSPIKGHGILYIRT